MSANDQRDDRQPVSIDSEQARLLFLSLSDEDRQEILRIMREKAEKSKREGK